MKMLKKLILGIALFAALFVTVVGAQTFYFIFIETPFSPNNYSWSEPWQVNEMIDFVDAQLTLTGCAYEGQSHDVELVLTNVATSSDYYLTDFDYSAKWYIDETHQENIIAGTYTGEPLAVGESVSYTDVWTPTIIGVGDIKMNVIDIVWGQGELITWTTEVVDESGQPSAYDVTDFVVTGASLSKIESGVVSFTIYNTVDAERGISFNVKIVELDQTVADETNARLTGLDYTDFSYNFDALEDGGAYTMRLTVTEWIPS